MGSPCPALTHYLCSYRWLLMRKVRQGHSLTNVNTILFTIQHVRKSHFASLSHLSGLENVIRDITWRQWPEFSQNQVCTQTIQSSSIYFNIYQESMMLWAQRGNKKMKICITFLQQIPRLKKEAYTCTERRDEPRIGKEQVNREFRGLWSWGLRSDGEKWMRKERR